MAEVPARWDVAQAEAAGRPPASVHWWSRFGDPGLAALVEAALRDAPDLAIARQRVVAARAYARAVDVALRPQLAFATDAAPSPDATRSWFVAGFDATWELAPFGRGNALRLDGRAGIAGADAALAARAHAGLAASGELAANDVAVARSRAAFLAASTDSANARERLALLLGRTPAALPWDDAPPPLVLPGDEVLAPPADVLRSRADVRDAEARVLAAAAARGIARADLYPRLSLGGSLTLAVPLSGGGAHAIGAAGPALQIPLFDWGQRRAVLTGRDTLLTAAEIDYRRTVLGAAADVRAALRSLQSARLAAAAGANAARAATAGVARASTLERLRLADGVARVDAELQALDAHATALESRRDAAIALIALYKAQGGVPPPADGA